MAISVDWANGIIHIPRADMIIVQSSPTEIRQLNTDQLRKDLRILEESEAGRPFPISVRYTGPITVGGVTLASVVEITDYYTVTFEDGQYAVNLVGSNNNVADRTNVNQVSVRSTNSAGLQDLSTLLASAYQGEVCVDVLNGQAGVAIPVGTRSTPVNNFADALTISHSLGISTFRILRSCTVATEDFSDGHTFVADNSVSIMVTLDTSANLANCAFQNMTVSGVLDSDTTLKQCNISSLTYFDGLIWQCSITGTISVAPGAQASIAESFSNVAGGGVGQTPTIDLNGSGDLALREFVGGLKIVNLSSVDCDVSLDFGSGRVIFDSTCTAGTAYVRGNCSIEDNSVGMTLVDQTTANLTKDKLFDTILPRV